MAEKDTINIMVTDYRPGATGKYHDTVLTLMNSNGVVFVKYGNMQNFDQMAANLHSFPGRVSLWGRTTGYRDDIVLGPEKLKFAIDRIGLSLKIDGTVFEINYKK
jgi:hypothetical protein